MVFEDKIKNSRRQFKNIFEEFKKCNPDISENMIIDFTPVLLDVIKVYLVDGNQILWNGKTKEIVDIL